MQVGNDPSNNCFQCSDASIRSCEELDRSHLHLAHRGGPEVGTGTGPYGDCRSDQCCVAVWSRWLESATRRLGFRALKKTLYAPYTTKVINRVHTSRGDNPARVCARDPRRVTATPETPPAGWRGRYVPVSRRGPPGAVSTRVES